MPEKVAGFEALRGCISALRRDDHRLYGCLKDLGGIRAADAGSSTLSRFLREDLAGDHDVMDRLVEHVLPRLAIWFHPEILARLPYLLPHVERDNDCRKLICDVPGHIKKSKGRTGEPRDLWSTPTKAGFVRDDNDLHIGELVGNDVAPLAERLTKYSAEIRRREV
ncbi:MAG: hypothetical protein HYY06_30310 [Deltaproteobacteria bacterium]|nr:hypothetical protein [Deltaproteobacteria bacterium]